MNPSRADWRFYQAHIANRGAPRWARPYAPRDASPAHVAEHLNAAINERAGPKPGQAAREAARMWGNTLALLRLVRANQARGYHREPDGSPSPRTLAGYMLRARCSDRYKYFCRLLRRMPAEILEAGRADVRTLTRSIIRGGY